MDSQKNLSIPQTCEVSHLVQPPSYPAPALSIKNLDIWNPKRKKQILKSVSLEAKFGEITAIMGPSGSGKTTLLRFVAGIVQKGLKTEGSKVIVGEFKFVSQDDHLHSFFTTEQYLDNYIGINYGFVKFEKRKELKNKIIGEMMLEKTRKTRVGDVFIHGLSGGEKRRLSIGLELVSKPSLLILDEPTSGLDSFAAEKVMEALDQLVKKEEIALVLTIHQPSSRIFKMLNKLIFMKEGEIMFHGPLNQIDNFFKLYDEERKHDYNPADQCLEILYYKSGKPMIHENDVALNIEGQGNYEMNEGAKKKITFDSKATLIEQFLFITLRNFKNLMMNPAVLIVRVIMYIILCFIVGAMFWDLGSRHNHESVISRTSVLFFVDAFLVFMSIAAVPSFMMERAIIEKEIRNKLYHPFVFQLSNWFTSWFGVFLIAIISTIFVVLMCNLNNFGMFLLNLFLSLMIAEGLAFLAALLVPHYIIAMALIAGFYGVFMLCEGFLIVYNDIPPWLIWVYYLAFHSYSFRIFIFNEFDSIQNFEASNFKTGKEVLNFYSMGDVNIGENLVILLCYGLAIQIVTAVVMKIKY